MDFSDKQLPSAATFDPHRAAQAVETFRRDRGERWAKDAAAVEKVVGNPRGHARLACLKVLVTVVDHFNGAVDGADGACRL